MVVTSCRTDTKHEFPPNRSRGLQFFLLGCLQLVLRHELPVLPLVVYLRGGPAGVVRATVGELLFGEEISTFGYRALGLSASPAEALLERPEPLAWALAACADAGELPRPERKLRCLEKVVERAELDPYRRFLLVNCVETYLELAGPEIDRFERLVESRGKEQTVAQALTWAEKHWQRGLAEGRAEGWLAGQRELLLHLLERRFGPVPAAARQRLDSIATREELERLAERVATAETLEETGLL